MRRMFFLAIAAAIFAAAAFGFQNRGTQGGRGQQPTPTADPYANNAAPGTTQFPLAAPAGKDSNARMVAPVGAVNQGTYDMDNWKYGTAFNPPAGSKIWNPVKLKMMQGGKVTGGTLFMRARWFWSCRLWIPSKKPSPRATGRIFRRWENAAMAAARLSMPTCGAASPVVIGTPSMTTLS